MTADPKYLYLNEDYHELLTTLLYGVQSRRGIILIIGDVGTGKTTILNTLRDNLNKNTKVAYIFNTDVSFKQMLYTSINQLKLDTSNRQMTVTETIQCLTKFAIKQSENGGNVAIIVDEAQNLKKSELENLRLLSNIETRKAKLIQILLCGQPKLDYKLSRPELSHLFQRISIKRYIKSLNETDTYGYIRHRLKIAGYDGPSIFDKNSLNLIWKNTDGIPLKINMLCENSLMISYAIGKALINENIVNEAIRSLAYSPFTYKNDY
jgi:general secretion pathway protein A